MTQSSSVTSVMSGLPRRRGIEALEQGQALSEDLVVVGRHREQRADGDVDAARLLVRELAVPQIRLVDDLGEPHEAAIAQARALDQRLERAVFAVMAQRSTGRVE